MNGASSPVVREGVSDEGWNEGREEEGREEEVVAPAQQLSFSPKRVPDEVIAEAREGENVIAAYCLFSGGNDSKVVAHRCRDHYESLVHIDTGTAVPGVRDFCEEFAAWLGKPLLIMTTPPQEYRRMVLGSDTLRKGGKPDIPLGFPGPPQHGSCYTRLKGRQVEALVRHSKLSQPISDRYARVLLLTGLRRAESARRRGRAEITRKGSQVWCNPLIDWTARDMWDYRDTHMRDAPTSDVAALLHRSGECNCGAFAAPGEREELMALFPEWWHETMGLLEQEAEAMGLVSARWGSWKADAFADDDLVGEMCSDCQLRIEGAA